VTFNNFDRKTVLTLALSCFIAGNLLAVAATSFPALLISRIFMALGAGLCAPTGLAIAVAIAGPERRGRAIALVSSGTTVATVLGAPIGTLIGNAFGWRSTFILVALLGAIALAGLLFGLPRGLPRTTATLGQRLAVAKRGAVLHALAITVFWAVSGFTVFTYLSAPLGGNQFRTADLRFGSGGRQPAGWRTGRPARRGPDRDAEPCRLDDRAHAAIGRTEICAARICTERLRWLAVLLGVRRMVVLSGPGRKSAQH
jgi:MFS family permease